MPASEAKIKANAKYNKKAYERVAFDVRRDAKINADYIRTHAASKGESVNSFLKRAVTETIERDNIKASEDKPDREE